jgi:hypothetical protein
VSARRFEATPSSAGDWVAFSQAWRETMSSEGHAFLSEAELQGLRPRGMVQTDPNRSA